MEVNGWSTMHVSLFIDLKHERITPNENISLLCIRRVMELGPGIPRNRRNLIDERCTNARNIVEDDIQDLSRLNSEIFDGNLNGAIDFEVTYNPNNVEEFSFICIFPNNQRQEYPVDVKGY